MSELATSMTRDIAAHDARTVRRFARLQAAIKAFGLSLAFAYLALVTVAALWPTLLAPGNPTSPNPVLVNQPPSLQHLFGTDQSGRDVFTRVVHGSYDSVSIGVQAVLAALLIGAVIGILASVMPRWIDTIILRITELLMAFPGFLIALVVVAILGRGTASIALGVTVAMIPAYIRMSRVLSGQIRNSEYLLAARVLGVPAWRSLFTHVLPNVLSQLLILAIIGFGTAITSTAGLSFLGLGLLPPAPEWGVIMNEGRNQLHNAWWITVSSGLALTFTIICVTVVARWLQQKISGVKFS